VGLASRVRRRRPFASSGGEGGRAIGLVSGADIRLNGTARKHCDGHMADARSSRRHAGQA